MNCDSRALRKHCKARACEWVVCAKCHATSGVVGAYTEGKFIGWKRSCFSRPPRMLG